MHMRVFDFVHFWKACVSGLKAWVQAKDKLFTILSDSLLSLPCIGCGICYKISIYFFPSLCSFVCSFLGFF